MIERLLLVVVLIGISVLAGHWWNRRSGRLRAAAASFGADELAAVGLDRDGAATLGLLFGSPTCAPCTTVRRLLGELEREHPGFRWSYVDAGDHLRLAERHGVRRVPTLFLIGTDGQLLLRASGVPDMAELSAALRSREPVRPAA